MTAHPNPTPEAPPERAAKIPEWLIECRVNLGTILDIAGEESDFGRLAWRIAQLIDRIGSGVTELRESNERLRAVVAERDAEILIWRAGSDRRAAEALAALMQITESFNDENPWLGVTAAVALLKMNQKPSEDEDVPDER